MDVQWSLTDAVIAERRRQDHEARLTRARRPQAETELDDENELCL